MVKEKKTVPKIVWKTAAQVNEERKNVERLPTDTPIDGIIGGGIERGDAIEFYGDNGAGKSQICFSVAAKVAAGGSDVVWIDAEGTFRTERLSEICQSRGYNAEEVGKLIHLTSPKDTMELAQTILQIPKSLTPKLVVLDSLITLHRSEYIGRGKLAERQGLLRSFLVSFLSYVKERQCYGIITNQIHDNPNEAFPNMPLYMRQIDAGGPAVQYHIINHRIFLRKGKGGTRIARLMDSSYLPEGEAAFRITERGVEGVERAEGETKEGEA